MADFEAGDELTKIANVIYRDLRSSFPFKIDFNAAYVAKQVGLKVSENSDPQRGTRYEIEDFPSGVNVGIASKALLTWLANANYVHVGSSVYNDVVLTRQGLEAFGLKPGFLPEYWAQPSVTEQD